MSKQKKLKFTFNKSKHFLLFDQENDLFVSLSSSELIFQTTEIKALNNENENGGFFLLVGPNSTGKSTFLSDLKNCTFSVINNKNDDEENSKVYSKENIKFLADDKEIDKLKSLKSGINLLKGSMFDKESKEKLQNTVLNEFIQKKEENNLSVDQYISEYIDQQKQNNQKFQELNKKILKRINMSLYPSIHLSLDPKFRIGENQKQSIELDTLSSGFKRILIFYCDHLLNKKIKKTEPETKVFLIDEIELFLHPNLIKIFLQIVEDLKKDGIYFIVSTHSDFVVKKIIESVDNIYVFSRVTKENSKTIFYINEFWNDSKNIIEEMSKNLRKYFNDDKPNSKEKFLKKMLAQVKVSLSEIFFTNKMIFVEGPSDQIVFDKMVSEIDGWKNYSVIFFNGKEMLFHTLALIIFAKNCWKEDNFEFYFILDRDGNNNKIKKDNLIEENIKKRQGKCHFLKNGKLEQYYEMDQSNEQRNSDKCFFALEFLYDSNREKAYEKLKNEIIDFLKN